MSRFADQAFIVLLAQLRMYRNMMGKRGKATSALNLIVSGIWYCFVAFLAVVVSGFISKAETAANLAPSIQYVLLAIFLYWQVVPILTVSFGLALDVKRLLVFPICPGQFFLLDLVLALPTSIEPLIVLGGVLAGLLRNPAVPAIYAIVAIMLFLCTNIFVGVAFRALVTKMSTLRWWREGLLLLALMLALTPQWMMLAEENDSWWSILNPIAGSVWLPWASAGNLASGVNALPSLLILLAWGGATFVAGRGLFHYFVSAESGPFRSTEVHPQSLVRRRGFSDLRALSAHILSKPFPDPVAFLVEKEFLTFSRSPRFITVFVMGFTFGIVVFLPIALGDNDEQPGLIAQNFLSMVSAYAILLMSETSFWNIFGLDRKSVQTYLFIPVPLQHVFVAKNIAAFVIVCFQVVLIAIVCGIIGLPVTPGGIVEASLTAVVLAINMFAMGNQSSVHYPVGVNPDASWSTANRAKSRLALILLFPLISLPTTLAYLARFALDSDWGFYGGMLIAALIAVCFYLVSLHSSVEYASNHREKLADLLGTTDSSV
jgi:ABC-2 type transport system permease protein